MFTPDGEKLLLIIIIIDFNLKCNYGSNNLFIVKANFLDVSGNRRPAVFPNKFKNTPSSRNIKFIEPLYRPTSNRCGIQLQTEDIKAPM